MKNKSAKIHLGPHSFIPRAENHMGASWNLSEQMPLQMRQGLWKVNHNGTVDSTSQGVTDRSPEIRTHTMEKMDLNEGMFTMPHSLPPQLSCLHPPHVCRFLLSLLTLSQNTDSHRVATESATAL